MKGNAVQEFVFQVMDSFGYIGIFALILIENLFPPIPSEVILTFGGFMTTYTSMTPAGVIAASTAGSVLGAVILYYAGHLIPREHMSRLLDGKVGHMLHFQKEDVGDAVEWFERRGMAAVLICRCVPIIRSLISIPAGMAGMRMLPFLLLTAAGSLVWNTALVLAGATAGASWERILEAMDAYSNAAVLLIGAAAFLGSCLYFRKREGQDRSEENGGER